MFGKNSICWTGHRTLEGLYLNTENPSETWKHVNSSVFNFIKRAYDKGWYNIVVGGALGVDMLVGLVVADMIVTGHWPELRLHLAIPHPDFNNFWKEPRDKESLEHLKKVAGSNNVHVLHQNVPFKPGPMLNMRNHFMVDNTTITAGIWDGRTERSGTYNCLRYAWSHRDKKIVCVMTPGTKDSITGFCKETWNTP